MIFPNVATKPYPQEWAAQAVVTPGRVIYKLDGVTIADYTDPAPWSAGTRVGLLPMYSSPIDNFSTTGLSGMTYSP